MRAYRSLGILVCSLLSLGGCAGSDDPPARQGPVIDAEFDAAPHDMGIDADVTPAICTPGTLSADPCPKRGVCAGSQAVCAPGGQWGPCDLPPQYVEDERACDGFDNDCDGTVDEGFDNIGEPCDGPDADLCAFGQTRCAPDGSGVECADDEAVVEICNGVDDDCDAVVDEADVDAPLAARQDGVCTGARQSCNPDGEGWVEPDYTRIAGYEEFEAACDGLDNDCDGRVDAGLFPPITARDAGLCAGLRQVCGGADGWQPPNFGMVDGFEPEELSCDGVDNDCDGTTDEATQAPECELIQGVCVNGAPPPECLGAAGFAACDYGPQYEAEEQNTCDAIDNDCDGVVDEGPACPVYLQAIRIAVGVFDMGSPLDEPNRENDEQQHGVELTHDLIVRRTEVVQEEWIALMDGANPSFHLGADRPVEQVSWVDAARFCNARSDADGLAPCYVFEGEAVTWPEGYACPGWRLPTEAEWEFLGRADTPGVHWGLDADPALPVTALAWHRANADSTRPVAQLAPAPNGLFDMLGNVAEWTYDAYVAYPVQAQVDPVAHDGVARVARGASYAALQRRVRVANRADFEIASRLRDLGLRLVRTAPVE